MALQYGGKLESGVTSLSNVDRVELANLLITVRDSAAREGAVVIYGFANENERNALVVARRRAEAVQEYLLSLGVWRHRINVDTKIWRNASLVPVSQRNQIEVEFIPACSPGGCENPCG
ncbi:OmpA family protein [Burkholderia sp. IMCC1007]|uniref:OmpA family protein n=1 Tax=Burkholderia sp. IMCC1007 TaxID=3004104 RepID=UPI0022B47F63|nr:OmpA family protein [Burkholderia sp. IMCC1007]